MAKQRAARTKLEIETQPLQKPKGKNYLFAIAINEYENIVKLNNAIKDVEEITDMLVRLYQFDPDCVFKLYNEKATEEGIDEQFLTLIEQVRENDNLLVFFSGHGYYRGGVEEGYWIPVDGRKDKVSDYISNSNLIKYLRNIKAHHVLLVVDSCFSGSLVEQLRGESNSERYPSRRVFSSGRKELVSDGIPGENSPFAKGIIDFLRANQEKAASTTSLIDSVTRYVEGKEKNQNPIEGRLRDSKDNGGEFFFRRKLTEDELWLRAQKGDSLESYQEYLDIFPKGKYASEANAGLRRKEIEAAWNKALANNTQDDYQDFILQYPESELIDLAKEKIERLKRAEEERRQILREKEKKEQEIEEHRQQFKALIHEAEEAFDKKDYRLARKKYWESQEYYMENHDFFPGEDYIEARKKVCSEFILFYEHSRDGKRSFKNKNYQLAIQYFSDALEIQQDEEIEKLLEAAQKLLEVDIKIEVKPGAGAGRKRRKEIKVEATGRKPSSRSRINVKAKRQPAGQMRGAGASTENRGEPLAVPPPAKKEKRRDLTFLWIALLILGYLAICKLFGWL